MQVKLLRVLQERCFEPVGSTATQTVDARVILASNVDLQELVAEGKFRQDLYYRINVVQIKMPPLRDRLGDIPLLANLFLRKLSKETGRNVTGFSADSMAMMQRYDWPGNVRELENAVERAVVLCKKPQIETDDLPDSIRQHPTTPGLTQASASSVDLLPPMPLERAMELPERRIIECALMRNNWNRQATATELDINRTTLYKKMRKYRLDVGESN